MKTGILVTSQLLINLYTYLRKRGENRQPPLPDHAILTLLEYVKRQNHRPVFNV